MVEKAKQIIRDLPFWPYNDIQDSIEKQVDAINNRRFDF